ncbi:MAG: hypothetical protein MJZ41_07695 [Bacteroidaceae bacterium]|nr:hypothetical protein [Bacteroidaceae bacterium]
MKKEILQKISDTAHGINVANGFNEAESTKRSIALIVSELAEMLEADRKGRWSKNIIEDLAKRDSNLIYGMTIRQAHQFIAAHEDSLAWFKECVKDTVEDELADVVIRIASYLAAIGYTMELDINSEDTIGYAAPNILSQDVPENIFDLMEGVVRCANMSPIELEKMAHYAFLYAEMLDIDLEWHVWAKLEYNKTRSHLHGKKY